MPATPAEKLTSPVFVLEDLIGAINVPEGSRVILNGKPLEEYNKTSESKGTPVRAVLFILYIIAVMIAMAVFSQTEPMLCVAAAGSLFLFVGLANLFTGLSVSDLLPKLLVPTVGALMTGIPVYIYYRRRHPDIGPEFTRNTLINIVLIGFGAIGVLLLITTWLDHVLKTSKCSETIEAKCIYRTYHIHRHDKAIAGSYTSSVYSPTWQYEVNGVTYVTTENIYSDAPAIGDTRQIMIDPNHPENTYRPVMKNLITSTIVGVAFTLAGFGVYFGLSGKL